MKLTVDKKKPRVVIVDDHPLIRAGICSLISETNEAEIVAEASDAKDILSLVREAKPDLVLMDISMPHSHGLEATKQIKQAFPQVKVLIFSLHDEEFHVAEALRSGASGYLMKEKAPETLMVAVRTILNGGVYVSENVSKRLLHFLAAPGKNRSSGSIDSLTKRQLEVFSWFGRGLNTRAVAEQMRLSIKTIETFRTQIKERLGVDDLTQLMRHAVEWVQRQTETSHKG